jgi:GNAT superfamily N-acetyltransferase
VCTSELHRERTPADEPKPDPTGDAIVSNLAKYWLTMGMNPAGDVHISDEISWDYSGGPFFNRVLNAHLDRDDADRYINGIIRTFRERQAAITWLIGPSDSPADLGERLLRHGFSRNETWHGMAHDLSGLDCPPIDYHGIDIVTISSDRERREWADVVTRSFEFPRSVNTLLRDSIGARSSTDAANWYHHLAYMNGTPVAACTLFVTDGVAGIYLVSTVPEARGQGLGTLMTWRALCQARDLGCTLGVLQSTESAHSIYEKLGFRYHCDIGVYRLAAPSPAWKRVASAGVRRFRRYLKFVPRRLRLNRAGTGHEPTEGRTGQAAATQTRS